MADDEMADGKAELVESRVRHRQEKVGVVTRAKMQKTIVVEVSQRVPHPLYKRIITRRSKFLVHDAEGKAHTGDTVRIVETRPLSRHKRWRLQAIVQPSSTRGV